MSTQTVEPCFLWLKNNNCPQYLLDVYFKQIASKLLPMYGKTLSHDQFQHKYGSYQTSNPAIYRILAFFYSHTTYESRNGQPPRWYIEDDIDPKCAIEHLETYAKCFSHTIDVPKDVITIDADETPPAQSKEMPDMSIEMPSSAKRLFEESEYKHYCVFFEQCCLNKIGEDRCMSVLGSGKIYEKPSESLIHFDSTGKPLSAQTTAYVVFDSAEKASNFESCISSIEHFRTQDVRNLLQKDAFSGGKYVPNTRWHRGKPLKHIIVSKQLWQYDSKGKAFSITK